MIRLPCLKYSSECCIESRVLGLNVGRFLEEERLKKAVDVVQARPYSGPGQVGNCGNRSSFWCLCCFSEEQCNLQGP